ncbi:hypothetical protein ACE1CD_23760 [Aerosakkonema sp. BLCC-F183]|uniref:hypothetical protein n=1 Tax=Aerosakkonema sp. BLCC-F183 TaxID=3342834 RepID=UPI0035BA52DD
MDNPFTASSGSTGNNDGSEQFYESITKARESRERGKISQEHECNQWVNDDGEVKSIADFLESDR